jgi:oligoribonuclease
MKKISNLAWIDLEMTGLDANNDTIVEIACIVTDKDLNIIAEGPSLVINTSEEKLSAMCDWVKNTHSKSGLIGLILESKITIEEAEAKVIEFFEKFCFVGISPLCGNSIWQDRIFLKKYMPGLPRRP